MKQVLILLTLALDLLLSACTNSVPSNLKSSLQITLNAPSGTTPSVVVLGPGNFKQTVSASITISPLTAGNYHLLPQSYRSKTGSVADTTLSADPQTIAVNGSQATITYAQAPGSGKLWTGMDFPNSGEPLILGFDTANLGSSNTNLSASIRLGQDASVDGPYDLAFDGGGNLWIVSRRQNQLVQYSVSQLGSSNPSLKPFRTLKSADFDGPQGLAFDSEGGLWVSNFGGGKVVHFSAYGLASATSTLSADRTLQGIFNPAGMAFDSTGNLWIADGSSSREQVFGFSPSKIASSGSPSPDFTITGGTATTPIGLKELAFDPSGNLWVSTNTHLFRYAKNTLSNPAAKPNIQLSPSTTATNVFAGLAFDNAGNLWATNFDGATSTLMMFAPANQVTGKVTPDRSIGSPDLLHPAYGLAFAPAASNLPMR